MAWAVQGEKVGDSRVGVPGAAHKSMAAAVVRDGAGEGVQLEGAVGERGLGERHGFEVLDF